MQIIFRVASNHTEHILPKYESHQIAPDAPYPNTRQTQPQPKVGESVQLELLTQAKNGVI